MELETAVLMATVPVTCDDSAIRVKLPKTTETKTIFFVVFTVTVILTTTK